MHLLLEIDNVRYGPLWQLFHLRMAWDASFARLMVQETLRHWTSGAYINYVFCILTNFSVRNYDSLLICL